MKLVFESKIEGKYLLALISGDYEIKELYSFLVPIYNECLKKQIFKILIDLRGVNVKNGIPTMDRFLLGKGISEVLSHEIKTAVVNHAKYVTNFGETVAVNRGAHMKVFNNIDEAETWLLNN